MKTLILLLILVGCDKKAIHTEVKKNGIGVELIIEHGGCRVFRFYDGRKVYFTDCSSTQSRYSCGKNCVRDEIVETIRD